MKKYLILMLSGALFTSCIDTEVLPNNVTIGEDYWQSKDDVTGMVMGAYKAMCTDNVMERCIVWGGFRSDELVPFGTSTNVTKIEDLVKINNGNMDNTNTYATWGDFYSVINKCNIVLEKGEAVVSIDPSYTMETWYTDQSQMLALRSLCYFYLVRAFRDVPYTTEAAMNSSQNFVIPQQAPLTVLDNCIADCQKALEHPLSPDAYSDWRRVGLMTKDGINALLADMYLWRASMTDSVADYNKCIEYCDAVIQSKQAQYPQTDFGDNTSEYPLIPGQNAYSSVFCQSGLSLNGGGNSRESIFELQMDGSNDLNGGIRNCYWNIGTGNSSYSLMKASPIFATEDPSSGVFMSGASTSDYRYYEAVFNPSGTSATDPNFYVRKQVSLVSLAHTSTSVGKSEKFDKNGLGRTSLQYIAQNWIVYRLSDVMLMKAEALTQIASDASSDANLQSAFELVNAVYSRSQVGSKELTYTNYDSKAEMEDLVLQERFRELCFEGKRWFDLMRYSYRHVDGVQPDKTMNEINNGSSSLAAFPNNYSTMMNLMERKYDSNAEAIGNKMSKEPHLYFPITQSELTVNNLLKQNPAYNKADTYVKK